MHPETQCVVDLELMKSIVKENIVSMLDHQYLNDVLSRQKELKGLPVTLENLSQFIWEILDKKLKENKINLNSIHVTESETLSVTLKRK